jgi:hypothetical protein
MERDYETERAGERDGASSGGSTVTETAKAGAVKLVRVAAVDLAGLDVHGADLAAGGQEEEDRHDAAMASSWARTG